MADRRRRRNSASESDSDVKTTTEEPVQKADGVGTPGVESSKEVVAEVLGDANANESDDAEAYDEEDYSDSQEEETEEDDDEECTSGSEGEEGSNEVDGDGAEAEGDTATVGGADEGDIEQRQSGDGQEQTEAAVLDDDEDTKNPAYIPRKGAFYEHDMRLEDDGDSESRTKPADDAAVDRPKKKLWSDADKWLHDRYDDSQQRPKSRDELISIYGYDIREHDSPPDGSAAPPMRRGRGYGPRSQRPNRLGDYIHERQRQQVYPHSRDHQDVVYDDDGDAASEQGGPPAGSEPRYYQRPQQSSWPRVERGSGGSGYRGYPRRGRGRRDDWAADAGRTAVAAEAAPAAAAQPGTPNNNIAAATREEVSSGTAAPASPASAATAAAPQSYKPQPSATDAASAAPASHHDTGAGGRPAADATPFSAAASAPAQAAPQLQRGDAPAARAFRAEGPRPARGRADQPSAAAGGGGGAQRPRDPRQAGPAAPRAAAVTESDMAPARGTAQQQQAKPKRYSSQRQRAASPVGQQQQAAAAAAGPESSSSASTPAGTSATAVPIVTREFYPSQHLQAAVPQQQQQHLPIAAAAAAGSAARGYVQHVTSGASPMPAAATQQVLAPAAMVHNAHYPGPVPMGPMHPGTARLVFAHPSVASMQPGGADQVLSGPRLGQPAPYMPGGASTGIIPPGPAMMFNIPGHPASHPPPAGMGAGAPAYVMPPGPMPVQFTSPGSRTQIVPGAQPGQEGYSVGGTTYYGAATMMPAPDVMAAGPQYYPSDGPPAATARANIVYYLPSAQQQTSRTPPRRQKSAIPIMRPEDVGFAQAGGEGLAVGLEGADRLAPPAGSGRIFESNHPAGEPCYAPDAVPGYESGVTTHPAAIKTVAAVHGDQTGRPPDIGGLEFQVSAIALGPAEGAASIHPVVEASVAGQSG